MHLRKFKLNNGTRWAFESKEGRNRISIIKVGKSISEVFSLRLDARFFVEIVVVTEVVVF
jgi:hypothetical protein